MAGTLSWSNAVTNAPGGLHWMPIGIRTIRSITNLPTLGPKAGGVA
jgi:hypothetical protein